MDAVGMKQVFQKHENGCGMACVAMVAGVSYDTACNKLFRTKSGRGTYSNTSQIKKALRRADLRTSRKCIRFKNGGVWSSKASKISPILGTDAIMICRSKKQLGTGSWHWVVWDHRAKRLRDPQEHPLNRKITSYLPVFR
jgi:hypothetical protein